MEKQICKIQRWTVVALEYTAEISCMEHSWLMALAATCRVYTVLVLRPCFLLAAPA